MDAILEVLQSLATAENIAGGGLVSAIIGTLAKNIHTRMSALYKRVAELEVSDTEKDEKLKDANDTIDTFRVSFAEIQKLYTQSLMQGANLNETTASLQTDLNKMGKLINELRSTILDKDNQITRLVSEVERLQPFEKLATERNGEIEKLNKRITELERHYELLQAETRGKQSVLDALTISKVKVVANEVDKETVK